MRIENGYLYLQDRRYDLMKVVAAAIVVAVLGWPLYFIAFA